MAAKCSEAQYHKKRLMVLCDGTWMNSNNGYDKQTRKLQDPSNVTRISRCLKPRCKDGTLQIISYHSGVGTGSNLLDRFTGGVFGHGLAERVREAYAYLCANYSDGDEIFLLGFSRGAFTVRSVAGMVGQLGLLTREGIEDFYPIFKDMQNRHNPGYRDPFPDKPFKDGEKPKDADGYRRKLVKLGLTRVNQGKTGQGPPIKIKAWHDTALSNCIENAFQALALDETRAPFSPAVWELNSNGPGATNLRQVWFPGNHGNCGGGWDDQGVANSTLAWMMDQMAPLGVEFDKPSLQRVVNQTKDFYKQPQEKSIISLKRKKSRWAVDEIQRGNQPLRPWALGAIQSQRSPVYVLSGPKARTPGMYKQVDPVTSQPTDQYLQGTNESIHSSVRVRLACEGLGLDDKKIWTCEALSHWRLEREEPIQGGLAKSDGDAYKHSHGEWKWTYTGNQDNAPTQKVMQEEGLGEYESFLLDETHGKPDVYGFAESADGSSRSIVATQHSTHTRSWLDMKVD